MKENEDTHQTPVPCAPASVLSATAAFSTDWDASGVRCRILLSHGGNFRRPTDVLYTPWRRLLAHVDDDWGSFGLCISGVGQGIRAKHTSEIICPPSFGFGSDLVRQIKTLTISKFR